MSGPEPERYPGLAAYWRSRLAAPAPHALPPADFPPGRPEVGVRFPVPASAAVRLKALTSDDQTLTLAVLAGSVALALSVWTARDSVVLDVGAAGTVFPMTFQADGADRVGDFFDRHRSALIGALARSVGVPSGLPRPGVLVTVDAAVPATAAASMVFVLKDGELALRADGIFRKETVGALAEFTLGILGGVASAGPRATVATLTSTAVKTPSHVFGPIRTYPREQVAALFAERCACSPDAIALFEADQEISYAELDGMAERVAAAIRGRGVPAGSLVAIRTARRAGDIAAALGVLRTGCGYLPLDDGMPADRERALIQAAGPAVVLAGPADATGRITVTDSAGPAEPAVPRGAAAPFCVLATSGSTGTPRLVEIEEAAVLNRLHWMWEEWPFGAGDRMAMVKPLSLVGSLWEAWGGLLRGVPTVVADAALVRDPAGLWTMLGDRRVTRLHGGPALLELLLHEAERRDGPLALGLCTTSGEPLELALARRWQARFPRTPLVNMYGLTECSSNVATGLVTAEQRDRAGSRPAGRCRTAGCTSSTGPASRCPRARSATSWSPARHWPGPSTAAGAGSSPWSRGSGPFAPVISAGSCPAASWK